MSQIFRDANDLPLIIEAVLKVRGNRAAMDAWVSCASEGLKQVNPEWDSSRSAAAVAGMCGAKFPGKPGDDWAMIDRAIRQARAQATTAGDVADPVVVSPPRRMPPGELRM